MKIPSIYCWWFGCERHEQDYREPDYVMCMRCDQNISYSDLVGDTMHYRFMRFISKFNWRRFFPAKCKECGMRRGHAKGCDWDIPF